MSLIDKFKIQTYNVGFVTKGIDAVMEEGLQAGDIRWMRHRYKDRFFADPFLLRADDAYFHILCEEYRFFEEKGKITYLKVDREGLALIERRVILEEPTHLSFPFCAENGHTVLPESVVSGKTFRYELDPVSLNILGKTELLAEGTVDGVIYTDEQGADWLYATKAQAPKRDLYVYKEKQDGTLAPVEAEPVLCDDSRARSAGAFFRRRGRLFRPVQDCVGRYGRQTKLMEILRIGADGYEAVEHLTLNSFENPPYNETMHTFNVYDSCILVDGSRDFLRFPMKLFYKKCRGLFRHRD